MIEMILCVAWGLGVLVSAVACWRPADAIAESSTGTLARLAATLGAAGAYVAAHAVLIGAPRWGSDEHSAAWLAIAAGVGGAALSVRSSRVSALLAAAALTALAAALVILPGAELEWRDPDSARQIGTIALSAAVLTLFATVALARGLAPGPAAALKLLFASFLVGGIAFVSSSAKHASSAAGVASVVAAALAVLVFRKRGRLEVGPTLVVSSVLSTVLAGSYLQTLADDRAPGTLFILVSTVLVASVIPAGRSKRARIGAALVFAALAIGSAVWIGTIAAEKSSEDSYGEYEY
jgi:hypothetical protein